MKKKVLMGLVLLIAIGTSAVFAQSNSIYMIEATFLNIEGSINKGNLENWVKDLQREASSLTRASAKRDYVYFKIRDTKASRSAVINGLAGLLPGPWEIPADAGMVAMNWTTQAQVAYAVACAYGKKPSAASFQMDLVMLLAGEDMAKEAGREIKSLTAAQLAQAGTINFKNNFNGAEQKKLITKIAEKMYAKKSDVAIAYAADKVVGKLLGPASALKDAFFASMDIKSMARAAQVYYYKFPMFSGRFISGNYGVALEFSTNGTVKVLPRLESADKGFIGDIRSQQQLGTGRYVIDKGNITITFGTVSWEKSVWNAKRPTSDTWKYVTVEQDLSNKSVWSRFDGEEVLEFPAINTGNAFWERCN